MLRVASRALMLALAGLALAATSALAHSGVFEAGAAEVDASWHVGASAGQYATQCTDSSAIQANRCSFIGDHGVDPTTDSILKDASYGIESRLSARALVIQGPEGNRYALVKADLYIPQDLLYRRVAEILEADNLSPDPSKHSGITAQTLTMAVTHDHSSPYYSSPSWGVWAFQDVFDARFYEYYAERLARAVELATQRLQPARVGAEVLSLDKPQRISVPPTTADDGTPAGYPWVDTDHDVSVVRFDTTEGRPIAVLANYGLHGESLNGNDLISADWIAVMQRVVDRETGAVTVFTQSAVGTTEMARAGVGHPLSAFLHDRLEFAHRDYAETDWSGHLVGDVVVKAWREIGANAPSDPSRYVSFMSGRMAFAMKDAWYPGPLSHPYPGVSSCRTQSALSGNPRLPVVGLPDCQSASDFTGFPGPPSTGVTTSQLEQAGIPIPENYSFPSYMALEEDMDVHLQALRIGSILFTICSCEQWKDQAENIITRTDQTANNEYWGFDWSDPNNSHTHTFDPYFTGYCTRNNDGTYGDYGSEQDPYGTGTWNCPSAADNPNSGHIPDKLIEHMRAQVRNPANGWNLQKNVAWAESERIGSNSKGQQTYNQIWGNFTQDDGCGADLNHPCAPGQQSPSARFGYRITVPMSMGNDYNGYIASYREYMRGDHYRKALTGWGPHSSDYMATRLVTMGRELKAPDVGKPWQLPSYEQDLVQEADSPALQAKVRADLANNDTRAAALGHLGQAAIAGYSAALPADGGTAAPVSQPHDIKRFDAAFFTWNGGDNFTDNPEVVVQRLDGDQWVDYADQSGEIPVTVKFPASQTKGGSPTDLASYATGTYDWLWTADFEAYVSWFAPSDRPRATPPGEYRFVVSGTRREGAIPRDVSYQVTSQPFKVVPWDGITVDKLSTVGGQVTFNVGPTHQLTGTQSEMDDTVTVGPNPLTASIGPIDYPDTYPDDAYHRANQPRFIRNYRMYERDPSTGATEWFCFTCSFRPWLDAGDATAAYVTFVAPNGTRAKVSATETAPGTWTASQTLPAGYSAYVAPGDVCDRWGDYNAAGAGSVPQGDPGMDCVPPDARTLIG